MIRQIEKDIIRKNTTRKTHWNAYRFRLRSRPQLNFRANIVSGSTIENGNRNWGPD